MIEKKVVLSKKEKKSKAVQITDCLAEGNLFKAKMLAAALYKGHNKGKSVFRIILMDILSGKFNSIYNADGNVSGYKENWYEFRYTVNIITPVILERFIEVISFLVKRDLLPIGKILTVSQVSDMMLYVKPEHFNFLFESGMVVMSEKNLRFQKQTSINGPITIADNFNRLPVATRKKTIQNFNLDPAIVLRLPLLLGILLKNFTQNVRYVLENTSENTLSVFSSTSERLMNIDTKIQRKDFLKNLVKERTQISTNDVKNIDGEDLQTFEELFRSTILPHVVFITDMLQSTVFTDPEIIYKKYDFNLEETSLSLKEKHP